MINNAREKKYILRKFTFDQKKLGKLQNQIQHANSQLQMMQTMLRDFCKSHFGEVYIGWIHLKIVKAFVESVLRYGVPSDNIPKYISFFVQPDSKLEPQALSALTSIIIKQIPELSAGYAIDNDSEETEDSEQLPYVFHSFNVVGAKK